jgi:cytoskeleton protein RodZ
MVETSETRESTVGAQLRAAREARGQTLDEIAQQTRIPARHLAQIEEGQLEGLPAATYSVGFVKAYARTVGLDPTDLSQQFRSELSHSPAATTRIAYEPYEPADPTRLPPRLLAIVALLIAILLAAGYAVWRSGLISGQGTDAPAQLAAQGDGTTAPGNTAAPAAATPATPAPAPAATGGAVVLTAVQPVWLKVSERAGATLFIGTLDQGKNFTVPATATDPVIRTGKPEALGVTVGGQPVAPLGKPAHVVSNLSLKPDFLRARPSDDTATPARRAESPAASGDEPTPAAAVPPAAGDGNTTQR